MKNIYIKLGLLIAVFTLVTSCDSDDGTGDATLNPSSPTLSVSLSFDNNTVLVEEDKTYAFTVSLSEPQEVNVKVNLSQTAGNAVRGVNFDFPNQVTIPAGATSASDVISIIRGEDASGPVSVTIQIATGVEANIQAINSETVKFTILNYEEADLVVGLSWAASSTTTDNSGEEIDPTDLADLRLLLTDVPYNSILGEADGGSFETYVLSGDAPDGEYYMVADFYDAMDDLDALLDLTVSFDQVGVINGETYTFDMALNTKDLCASPYYIMAKVTKVGDSYTIESVGEASQIKVASYVGTWTGSNGYGDTEVVTTMNSSGQLEITGMGVIFMTDSWGEVITLQNTLVMDLDLATGNFTIAEAPYMETTYEGDVTDPYSLSAVGVLNVCDNTIDIDYDFVQAGTSYTDWLTVGNGWPEFRELNTLQ